jgi:uncharacterized membrane protein YwaF
VNILIKEFLGLGGYAREPEGYMSWQHLTFVSLLMVIMVALAVVLGLRYKNRGDKEKTRVLVVSAIAIDSLEIFKIVILCIRGEDPWHWLYVLPLFLCSIQLITIPLAAFAKGRIRRVALDFVFVFGILGAVLGTYGAGQNYACYPVLSLDNVVSGLTHSISGFCSLYIAISGMASMKRRNIPISFAILTSFCIVAYLANIILDYNYMFLMAGDGTPYDILYDLVGGHKVLYPIGVVSLFYLYITAFYFIYYFAVRRKKEKTPLSVVGENVCEEAYDLQAANHSN